MKKLWCTLSMLLFLWITAEICAGNWAFADSQVRPPNGATWGDPNGTASLLQMTKDPDSVTKTQGGSAGIKVAQTCKDAQGNTYLPKDPGFESCMAGARNNADKKSAGIQLSR